MRPFLAPLFQDDLPSGQRMTTTTLPRRLFSLLHEHRPFRARLAPAVLPVD